MSKRFFGFLILIIFAIEHSLAQENCSDYESNIVFYGFKDKDAISEPFISTFNESIETFGCGPQTNVSIIVHGWLEGLNTTEWVNRTIYNLLKHTNGCVFFMDYSVYSKNGNYWALVNHYDGIMEILRRKLLHIEHPERMFMFGFSFGSRLSIDAATRAYNGSVERIEVCDPAGPGFVNTPREKEPMLAAKNIACISTSNNYGTTNYNCHQNFRMGNCGYSQAAASSYPKGHHGLCPYMWQEAFDYDFVPYNWYGCSSNRLANLTGEDVKMGFLGNFNRTKVRGDIFISTSGREPYVAVETASVYAETLNMNRQVQWFDNQQYSRRTEEGDITMVKQRQELWEGTERLVKALEKFLERLSRSAPASLQRLRPVEKN